MPITTLKVLSTVLQLHGPGATIQSDHQGINAVLNDLRGQNAKPTEVYFRRGGFVRGGGYGGEQINHGTAHKQQGERALRSWRKTRRPGRSGPA